MILYDPLRFPCNSLLFLVILAIPCRSLGNLLRSFEDPFEIPWKSLGNLLWSLEDPLAGRGGAAPMEVTTVTKLVSSLIAVRVGEFPGREFTTVSKR